MPKTAPRAMALAMAAATLCSFAAYADPGHRFDNDSDDDDWEAKGEGVQLGPRPFYLVEGMDEGKLKDRLM